MKCTCASVARPRSRRASTVSIRRAARISSAPRTPSPRSASSWKPTASPISASRACARRSAPPATILLHVLLHRRLSGLVPAERRGVPPARAQGRRLVSDACEIGLPSRWSCWVAWRRCRSRRPAQVAPGTGRAARHRRRSRRRRSKRRSTSSARSTSRSAWMPAAPCAAPTRPLRCRRSSRRSPAHADSYVRFKALVVLSGFNDPRIRRHDDQGARRSERSAARRGVRLVRASS